MNYSYHNSALNTFLNRIIVAPSCEDRNQLMSEFVYTLDETMCEIIDCDLPIAQLVCENCKYDEGKD